MTALSISWLMPKIARLVSSIGSLKLSTPATVGPGAAQPEAISPRANRPETKRGNRRNNIASLVTDPNGAIIAGDNDEKRATRARDPSSHQHLSRSGRG